MSAPLARDYLTVAVVIAALIPLSWASFQIGERHGEILSADYTEVYFCPDLCLERVASVIGSANRSIYVAVSIFESELLADTLIKAKERGVDVEVVVERLWTAVPTSMDKKLIESGVKLRYDTNPAVMHSKFVVLDNSTVVSGSFNFWKDSDWRRDDNIVVIRSSREAELFTKEFSSLFAAGVAE